MTMMKRGKSNKNRRKKWRKEGGIRGREGKNGGKREK